MTKKLKIFSILSITIILIVVITTIIINASIKNVIESRDTRLDTYEATKMWVIEDIRSYLLIRDKNSYIQSKQNMHMGSEVKSEIFGSEFEASNHQGYTNVSFLDAQYTLEKSGKVIYYLLADVTKGEETKQLNFMVFVSNNTIYDIVAY
jgi:hypothetical protein